jgi:hypothetical protein
MDKIEMTIEELRDLVFIYNKLLELGYDLEDSKYDIVEINYECVNAGFLVNISNISEPIFLEYEF